MIERVLELKAHVLMFIIVFFTPHHPQKFTKISYKILDPKGVEALKDSKEPKKTASAILDSVHLDAELYRLGNTKA